MYISETPNTGDTFSTATAIAGQMSYSSDGGDCLGLAQSTDTADCQGTWTVPNNLQPGRYTIMWWWEFNAGEFYNSCADVMITAAADGGGGTPCEQAGPRGVRLRRAPPPRVGGGLLGPRRPHRWRKPSFAPARTLLAVFRPSSSFLRSSFIFA